MSLISIFLTGIGLAMDAVAVSIAKGMTLRKNLLKNAIKMGLFFGIFQAIMPFIGWFAGIYFKDYIEAFDHWIAFILLSIIGGKMIYESIKSRKEEKELSEKELVDEVTVDEDECDELNNKNLIILAIATSIDALAVGVSFAFLNVSIVKAMIIIGGTTFVLCIIAALIGKKLGGVFQKYAESAGGLILILIGLKILLEHL
ncbi:manganese efflux pump MntP [Clostridium sp.]|uniref:manganese efflux pump MntP n=1 Tax=Clostridium sp. TaxID=1506 RepID=UPI002FC76D09